MIGGWALPRLVGAGALMLAAHGCATADALADFYRGRTISLYVGFPPGGGYDLYARVFALADKLIGKPAPRAVLPQIPLHSPKITRNLTTDWFANRVEGRYQTCLQRLPA